VARTGRPTVPKEVKESRGTQTKRKSTVVATRPTDVVTLPVGDRSAIRRNPPASLRVQGRALWARCWADEIRWLSPASDIEAVTNACICG
jgi:hypothetical protein